MSDREWAEWLAMMAKQSREVAESMGRVADALGNLEHVARRHIEEKRARALRRNAEGRATARRNTP